MFDVGSNTAVCVSEIVMFKIVELKFQSSC